MKHITLYENFNPVNENWFLAAYQWIKGKLKEWISNLTGQLKDGALAGMDYIKQNPGQIDSIIEELKVQEHNELSGLLNWIKSISGDESQLRSLLIEESEESPESTLKKIANIAGASAGIISIFAPIATGLYGLYTSNGVLFTIGSIITVIAFSIIGALNDN